MSDKHDLKAARLQLQAGDKTRLAIADLASAEDLISIPAQDQLKRVGLWGRYPDGHVSPYGFAHANEFVHEDNYV